MNDDNNSFISVNSHSPVVSIRGLRVSLVRPFRVLNFVRVLNMIIEKGHTK